MATIFEMLKAANKESKEVKTKKIYKKEPTSKEKQERTRYLIKLQLDGKSECSKCKKIINIDMFWPSRNGFGYQSACKLCLKLAKRKNGETNLIIRRDYLKSLREKGMSECSKCKIVKPLSSFFGLHKGNLVGSRCKECEKERKRKQGSTIHLRLAYLKELLKKGKSGCSKCKKVMNLDMFYKSRKNTGKGVMSWCRECQREEGKISREKKKLKKLEV